MFDCDGTLLDTMPLYYESWSRSCEELGLKFPIERFYSLAGVPVKDIFQTLIDEQVHWSCGEKQNEICSDDSDKTTSVLTAEYCEEVKRRHHADIEAEGWIAGPIDVVVRIARQYHGKIPMAVASSGWRDHVITGLERAGILHLFDAVVTSDDDAVQKPKPSPDIYLVAAERMGVCPTKCVGFEDADFGIQALRKAGYLYVSDVRRFYMYPRNMEIRVSSQTAVNPLVEEGETKGENNARGF